MDQKARTCPRDRTELAAHQARAFACHQCGQCGGILVAHAALAGSVIRAGDKPSSRFADLPPGELACPTCAEPMRRLVHKGTEIDVCAHCRVFWLDAGEWERIAKPASTKGSKFGRTVALTAAAAAGGVALGVAASGAAQAGGATGIGSNLAGLGANVAGEVAGEVGGAVLEIVFEFIGEALGSLF